MNKIKFPCFDNLKMVNIKKLKANDYNPNKMDRRMFELLKKSITEDGLTMPIVTFYNEKEDVYEIVDGFHRYSVLLKMKVDEVPVSIIDKPINDRKISTIRHNKAKGTHQLKLVADILKDLMNDENIDLVEIMERLAFIPEELVIYDKGLNVSKEFDNVDFSNSWERDYKKEAELYNNKSIKKLYDEFED